MNHAPGAETPLARSLLALTLPAALVGVVCAFLLWGAEELALVLEHLWWGALPDALGVGEARWWPLVILTITGALIGLVVERAPGHAGYDSAQVELNAPPLPLRALPGVAIVLVLALAGGVSLGPESPIIALGVGLTVWGARRFLPAVPVQLAMVTAFAGIIAAMFSGPFAAALLLTEALAAAKGPGGLWDRMFLPMVSAVAASITARALGMPSLIGDLGPADVTLASTGWAVLIAVAAAAFGVAATYLLPIAHRAFRRLRRPLLYTTAGGLVLGVLGTIGGEITMFKGSAATAQIISEADTIALGSLVGILVIKTAALVVSAAAGFRGGRIFPAIFIGAATGVLGHAILPDVSIGLAVGAGVLGTVLAVSKSGWMALFGGVIIVGDVTVISALIAVLLPLWLLLARVPEMIVHAPGQLDSPPEEAPEAAPNRG